MILKLKTENFPEISEILRNFDENIRYFQQFFMYFHEYFGEIREILGKFPVFNFKVILKKSPEDVNDRIFFRHP